MSAVRPVVQPPVISEHSENAPHYGVLMGGPVEIKLDGIGEASVGHLRIPRRSLAEFTQIHVGRRNESEMSLTNESAQLHAQWYNNPDRIVVKSPRACAREVHATFGERGFLIPTSLIGKNYDVAVSMFDAVMPKGTLNEVIAGLLASSFEDSDRENLRLELLEGAYVSHAYITRYTEEMSTEVGNSLKTGKGKGGFDSLDKEYFRELNKPLPEEVPAIATLAMGKEIAASLNASKGSGSDDLLKALLEQNQLLMQQFTSKQAQAETVTESKAPKADAIKPSKVASKE